MSAEELVPPTQRCIQPRRNLLIKRLLKGGLRLKPLKIETINWLKMSMSSLLSPRHENEPPARAPIPQSRNFDGRPVWEPPIFSYTEWINEEHDKKRKVILRHFNGTRARTTDFMDIETEREILRVYTQWLWENKDAAEDKLDLEEAAWFKAFWKEVLEDSHEVQGDIREHDIYLAKDNDGEWVIKGPHYPFKEDGSTCGSCSDEDNHGGSAASISSYIDLNTQEFETSSITDSQSGRSSNSEPFGQSSLTPLEAWSSSTEEAMSFDEATQRLSSDFQPRPITNQDSVSNTKDGTGPIPFDLFAIWS